MLDVIILPQNTINKECSRKLRSDGYIQGIDCGHGFMNVCYLKFFPVIYMLIWMFLYVNNTSRIKLFRNKIHYAKSHNTFFIPFEEMYINLWNILYKFINLEYWMVIAKTLLFLYYRYRQNTHTHTNTRTHTYIWRPNMWRKTLFSLIPKFSLSPFYLTAALLFLCKFYLLPL